MSATTIVGPIGVPIRIEIRKPVIVHTTEVITEHIVTERKLLNMRIDDSAGKIISADTSSEPTRFIASTITTAIITAVRKLFSFARVPVATAKFSSKVTENILLWFYRNILEFLPKVFCFYIFIIQNSFYLSTTFYRIFSVKWKGNL